MSERLWTVRVWDCFATHEYQVFGTYDQVSNTMTRYPQSYIWSIT